MKINIGGIAFEVRSVPEGLRAALLSDPGLGATRAAVVWSWDHETRKGQAHVPLSAKGSVPLPNGLAFFVPRTLDDGRIVKNDKPSETMGKRFLGAVGAGALTDVLGSIQQLLKVPQKGLPLDHFAALNDLASYELLMQADFSVVELSESSRNLSVYLFVPGQVRFAHRLKEGAPPEAAEAITKPPPAFLIPTWSKPNHHIRMLALTRRAKELQPQVEAMRAGDRQRDPATINALAATIAELRGLAKPPEPASVH